MITRSAVRAFSTEGLKVVNDVAKQQFTVSLRGIDATLSYVESGKGITFVYTEVPDQFKGKGVGKLLAKTAFDHASNKNLDVTCKCHFLASFYEKNAVKYKNLNIKIDLESD